MEQQRTPELEPQINRNSVYHKSQITQVKTRFLINGAGAIRWPSGKT